MRISSCNFNIVIRHTTLLSICQQNYLILLHMDPHRAEMQNISFCICTDSATYVVLHHLEMERCSETYTAACIHPATYTAARALPGNAENRLLLVCYHILQLQGTPHSIHSRPLSTLERDTHLYT